MGMMFNCPPSLSSKDRIDLCATERNYRSSHILHQRCALVSFVLTQCGRETRPHCAAAEGLACQDNTQKLAI
jgi:hypothetical protein